MRVVSKCLSVILIVHHAGAFTLKMSSSDPLSSSLPPPFRAIASPPPASSSTRSSPPSSFRLASTSASATVDETTASTVGDSTEKKPPKTRKLGLITFDLDDSLYPISPVLFDANKVFSRAMSNYGYDIDPQDIVEMGKKIRQEAGPIAGTAMSHTEVRLKAIRREMEEKMFEKKLKECAEDWATEVESVTLPIRKSAEKWAKSSVSQSVVESIYSSWERERHHSAERHLYPEIISALQQIKEQHPDVIIGAVTDGKANPMLMVFSLAPYFDFCMSWEDDASGRTEFFKELGNVDGNADLQWIYRAAFEKYLSLAENQREMAKVDDSVSDSGSDGLDGAGDDVETVWIHIGDDLAYDVGGSASCGAKTILLDLDEDYGQTAKLRFLEGGNAVNPSWNTASKEEIANRKAMNDAAEVMVDKRVSRLTMLPDAIDEILKGV